MQLDVRRSHAPFKQLLYVEWILLGMAVMVTLSSMVLFQGQQSAWGELSLILGLTVMGLHLPQRWFLKFSYTVLELGSLLLLTL